MMSRYSRPVSVSCQLELLDRSDKLWHYRSRKMADCPFSDQPHLLWRGGRDAHALDPAVGRVQDFKLQALIFDDFAFFRNAPCNLAHQTSYGGGFVAFGAHAEEFIQSVNIHVARDDVGVVVFLHDLRLLVLVADLSDYFLNQILDRYQACDSSVFVHDNCHADVTALHLAQQVTY